MRNANSPSPESNSVVLEPMSLADVRSIGSGLVRPECVLATASGDLYSADWRGGVAHIAPDGSQRLYTAQVMDGEVLKPNGIALQNDGSFLLAHLGSELGGVFHLQRDGSTRPFLQTVHGIDLPPTNFVVSDSLGRTWITVSTRLKPRALGYRRSCQDGCCTQEQTTAPCKRKPRSSRWSSCQRVCAQSSRGKHCTSDTWQTPCADRARGAAMTANIEPAM